MFRYLHMTRGSAGGIGIGGAIAGMGAAKILDILVAVKPKSCRIE